MMNDLISRSELIDLIRAVARKQQRKGGNASLYDACVQLAAVIGEVPAVDAVPVIRCKDCGHCFELDSSNPRTSYHGGKDGYYCAAWDMDFYTPHCNPETYYCADAKPRGADRPAGLYADRDTFQDTLMPAT